MRCAARRGAVRVVGVRVGCEWWERECAVLRASEWWSAARCDIAIHGMPCEWNGVEWGRSIIEF